MSHRLRGGAVAALIALATLVALMVAPGYAAGLTLVGKSRPFAATSSSCTTGTLTVAPSGTPVAGKYTAVTVSGIKGSTCATGRVIVYGSSAPGTIVFTGTGTVTGTTMTATSSAFTPPASAAAAVYLTLNGWLVRATWAYTPPPPPLLSCTTPYDATATCTATVASGTQWPTPPTDYLGMVRISTTSTTAVRWRITMNLSDATLPFLAKALLDTQGGLVLIGTVDCAATPRTITVEGTTAWGNYNTVVAGRTENLQVHGYSTVQSGTLLLRCP
ncbi:hypothetical protein HP550_16815 [Cellulomonas humilata]|uniref:Uncharacterized protein n=1 Tax=Cellulomonas humilata TaxID=144055 RepID=A0A7Y6A4V2_9CELL|nr:hypothetical protein [Cellulomonas humilata]NUU18915.1 hypothetical protein [Cellulomonas humilata]